MNSLDPNGIVWRLGKPQFRKVSRVVSWFVYKGLCGLHKLFETFGVFSFIGSLFDAIFSQDIAKEGSLTFGNISCTFKG